MILNLAQGADFVQVTAQYSNAVLVAMLPYISEFAHKLDLPVPHPIRVEHIVGAGVLPWCDHDGGIGGGGIGVGGGYGFSFQFGYVNTFEGPHSYYALQDPSEIPKFVGTVRMNQDEAVQMARDTLRKLAIPLESVFAEQEPRVTLPPKTRTGTVPHYRIEWLNPRVGSASQNGSASVEVEVNADAKRVERLSLNNRSLHRPSPKVAVAPLYRSKASSANPEYAWKLIPIVLRAVDEYGKTLALPIPRPLTTNHVAHFHLEDNLGRPHSELELTNGWRFIYRDNMVNGYYAPDNLFSSDQRPILIKDFVGKWNMTEAEAITMIRRTLAKLNYPTNLVRMDFTPKVNKPALQSIPRYSFWWWSENETKDNLVSKVEAEVDADKRELKSLYFEHKSFWSDQPPIDVPISLPQPVETNSTRRGNLSAPTQKPPARPFKPIAPPRK